MHEGQYEETDYNYVVDYGLGLPMYLCRVTDFPGCFGRGETPELAEKAARESVFQALCGHSLACTLPPTPASALKNALAREPVAPQAPVKLDPALDPLVAAVHTLDPGRFYLIHIREAVAPEAVERFRDHMRRYIPNAVIVAVPNDVDIFDLETKTGVVATKERS